jgi:hypothetical protein
MIFTGRHRATFLKCVVAGLFMTVGLQAKSQDNESPPNEPPYNNTELLDAEMDAINGPPVNDEPPPSAAVPTPQKPALSSNQLETSSTLKTEPQFVKPEGSRRGGVLRVPHPNAAKGLSRINIDGSYQYKVRLKPKSRSSSLRFGAMAPPSITGATTSAGTKDFESFYGSSNIVSVNFDYEWQPFINFGRLGLVLGSGFATVRGSGYFKSSGAEADEVYNLYIVPLSAFVSYRFEYARRQWAVPFVKAGGTYFGLVEARDDNKSPTLAGAPTVGGGGGVHFSITAFDSQGAFILDREYGIADMYLTLEAQVLQGLSSDIDFSTQMVNLGVTVDF